MGLIKFRKGRELEVGIETRREFEFGVGRLERDVDFDIANGTNCGWLIAQHLALIGGSVETASVGRECPITCLQVILQLEGSLL
jgi:hypothetical protein